MIQIKPRDDSLRVLKDQEITSNFGRSVTYRIGAPLGEGGMAVAFYAIRSSPEGSCPVVLKVLRPSIVRQSPHSSIIVQKEAVALGRLNEHVPPTPFVVRLIDTGSLPIQQGSDAFELPWLAVEYVHGGVEGTTLTKRVRYSIESTKHSFDRARAGRAIECITRALTTVHEVGVIHRDMKPDNVLCCGFGDEEIFKIADFGIARPEGLAATFAGAMIGTPGYAAPEQFTTSDPAAIGPWTDVFSLAATLFFLITGERYFPPKDLLEYVAMVASPTRRSVLQVPTLSLDLRSDTNACRAIDAELAKATAVDRKNRYQSVDAFAASLLRWFPSESLRARVPHERIDSVILDARALRVDAWTWTTRHHPGRCKEIRSVSWDGDGRCLAATDAGLLFWDGTSWRDAALSESMNARGIRFVSRTGPGRWLVGGDGAVIATFTGEGFEGVTRASDATVSYSHFSGDANDLGIIVGRAPTSPPVLYARAGRWWLKPLPLQGIAAINAIARVDLTRWLLVGEATDRSGFAAVYSPLNWEVERMATPGVGSLIACAGSAERRVGAAVGAGGAVVLRGEHRAWVEAVSGQPTLTAVAVDAAGRVWAGSAGRLYQRNLTGTQAEKWECVWEDAGWKAPIASIYADISQVIAITTDGGVIEGRHVDLPVEIS
jgi:serine/threonine protein kinase